MGLTELTFEKYTPIALVNQDPAAIHVKAEAPYKNVKELFAHIKANPKTRWWPQARGRAEAGMSRSPA